MSLLLFDRTMDYINLAVIVINVLFVLYLKYFNYRFKKLTKMNLLSSKCGTFLDGILIIEFFFFAALYTWIGTEGDEALGGIADPSLLFYLVAEHTKSFYFLSVILLTWRNIKKEAKNIISIIEGL
jgi:hypothetical protein